MGSITLVNGVILSVVLWYFSFNFISKIFTSSVAIAAILALAVEITKIITNYYASSFSIKRSEEHTSELQSLMRISYAVFCLKKKKKQTTSKNYNHKSHN